MQPKVSEVLKRVEHAERVVVRLATIPDRLDPRLREERQWLAAAQSRLSAATAAVRQSVEHGFGLPELEKLRAERDASVERAWIDALIGLFESLKQHLGETSPLIEALFPHRRFDKLRRGGAVLREYRLEFATRRSSTYVRRMAADPEYGFLSTLFEPLDRASAALTESAATAEIGDARQAELRARIVEAGEALTRVLRQARSLSDAALIDQPELIAELGFDERSRRRS